MCDLSNLISTIANIATALGFFLVAYALFLQYKQRKEEQQLAVRDATWKVFDRWWGKDLADLREYFYQFVEVHSKDIKALRRKGNVGLGQIKDYFHEDDGRLRDITYFFDQVGWLGANGLVDVDYILGPMQPVMRRVWWTTDFLIRNQREPLEDRWLDPVRHWGLQWLFERSEAQSQVELLKGRFHHLSLLSKPYLEQLEKYIQADEEKFKKSVGYEQTRGGSG